MAKIIAKLEKDNYLVEMSLFDIQRLNQLKVGYNTYGKIFNVGDEFPITLNIESLMDKVKKITSTNLFHNLKKEMDEVLHTIHKLEEQNKIWQQEKD